MTNTNIIEESLIKNGFEEITNTIITNACILLPLDFKDIKGYKSSRTWHHVQKSFTSNYNQDKDWLSDFYVCIAIRDDDKKEYYFFKKHGYSIPKPMSFDDLLLKISITDSHQF